MMNEAVLVEAETDKDKPHKDDRGHKTQYCRGASASLATETGFEKEEIL